MLPAIQAIQAIRRPRSWVTLLLALALSGASSAENYLGYYQSVADAEAAAIDHRYGEAVQQYEAAFAAYPYNHPVDCYVAAQLAAYNGDTARCLSLLRRGFCFGLPLPTVRGNPHLARYVREGFPLALPQAVIDSCWQVYEARIDRPVRATLLGLIRRDQSFIRQLPPGGSLYERDGITLKAVYQPLWDSLLREVVRLTRESGFPAAKTTGTQTSDDSMLAVRPQSLYAYYILIHHGRAWPQLGPLLRTELETGNITPQLYGALADQSNRGQQGPLPYMALRDCAAFVSPRACRKALRDRLPALDSARRAIGLCTYAVMRQKRESILAYRNWVRKGARTPEPVFDFQSELHF